MKRLVLLATLAAAPLIAASALATEITQSQTIASQSANWSSNFTFDQFNPAQGALTGLTFGLTGTVDGTLQIENRERTATTVNGKLNASISSLASATPTTSTSVGLGAFDGTVDFAGSSGRSLTFATGTATGNYASGPLGNGPPAPVIQPFLGDGTVNVPVGASVSSQIIGGANMVGRVQSAAGASGTLTYQFDTTNGQGGGLGSIGVRIDIGGHISYDIEPAGAVSTARQMRTVASQTTGWVEQLAFNKFDPSLGSLYQVNIGLYITVTADPRYENLSDGAAPITVLQTALLNLELADGRDLAALGVGVTDSANLAAFDGVEDFDGPSGVVRTGLQRWNMSSATVIDGGIRELFTGTDDILLALSTLGAGKVDGGATMFFDLAAKAGAQVELNYTYIPAALLVSEPTPLALFAGLFGLWAVRRRTRF